ncbi:hypothetical protein MCUN1_003735 [Malassezia cuniculi]|uniref:Amino acid permease/ SLC12A domain-containing protein n=1 Tax=Malassezia cuniculi TaxID=948313 RepID=A0AAF0EXH7_9BASI|nr:hypothetical protein MCUN1_003735 [Malassezia cuniculi]
MGLLQRWVDSFKPAEVGFGSEVAYAESPEQALSIPQTEKEKSEHFGTDEFANATVSVRTEEGGVAFVPEETGLKRDLSMRHIQFIALGGSIGTGLFIGTAGTLTTGGPLFLILDYLIVCFMIVPVVFALGELACIFPVTGAFSAYATRFMDPAWGFAMGWNYWLQWAVCLPLEFTAATIVVSYWDQPVPLGAWIAIFFVVIIVINIFGVKGYGEFEFGAALLKILGVVGFIIFAIVTVAGGAGKIPDPNNPEQLVSFCNVYCKHNWVEPISNKFKGFSSVFISAAFAFAGTELVGLAAAETANPRKALPKACQQVIMRVIIFYVLSLLFVTLMVSKNDNRLSEGDGSGYDPRTSPFVLALKNSGVTALDHIINAVILISAMSVANASVYGSSRTLHSLAEQRLAPSIFKYVDREGRPLPAVGLALLLGFIAFIMYSSSQGEVFSWLIGISGLSTIFTWASICACHIRFRAGWAKQGFTHGQLPWATPFGLIGSWVGLIINILVIAVSIYVNAFPIGEGEMTPRERGKAFFVQMVSLPIVLISYIGAKIIMRSRVVKASEMDLFTGRREALSEEYLEQERAILRARPLWKKIKDFLF